MPEIIKNLDSNGFTSANISANEYDGKKTWDRIKLYKNMKNPEDIDLNIEGQIFHYAPRVHEVFEDDFLYTKTDEYEANLYYLVQQFGVSDHFWVIAEKVNHGNINNTIYQKQHEMEVVGHTQGLTAARELLLETWEKSNENKNDVARVNTAKKELLETWEKRDHIREPIDLNIGGQEIRYHPKSHDIVDKEIVSAKVTENSAVFYYITPSQGTKENTFNVIGERVELSKKTPRTKIHIVFDEIYQNEDNMKNFGYEIDGIENAREEVMKKCRESALISPEDQYKQFALSR